MYQAVTVQHRDDYMHKQLQHYSTVVTIRTSYYNIKTVVNVCIKRNNNKTQWQL